MITQGDQNKSHSHNVTDSGHTHNSVSAAYTTYTVASGQDYGGAWVGGSSAYQATTSEKTGISINSNGGIESRPINTSLRIWKRTA